MQLADDKSLLNVLNAAVTSNHQQVKSQLHNLIAQVNCIPHRDNPNTDDIVIDVVNAIKEIEHKLDDVTDWLRLMKVAHEEK
jgi:RNA processing factor Prp31